MGKTLLIRGLKESWPQCTVYLDSAADNCPSKGVFIPLAALAELFVYIHRV